MIRDSLMLVGSMTAACIVALSLLCLGHSLLLMLSYWSVKAEHYESLEDFRQQRQDLRNLALPALLTIVSGLLVSLSASLLLRTFDAGLPEGWNSLLMAGLTLIMTGIVVDLVLAQVRRMRRRESSRDPHSAAHIRVLAQHMTGAEPNVRDFLSASRLRLDELRDGTSIAMQAFAGDLRADELAGFADIIPAHPAIPLHQALQRRNARAVAALVRSIWSAAIPRSTWPGLLPVLWAITGLWLGFARDEDHVDIDFFGLSLANAGSGPLGDSPVASLIGSGLPSALLLAGIGLVLGILVIAPYYFAAGVTTFRLIAAGRFEFEQTEQELDALEQRIDRIPDRRLRSVRAFWRRLIRTG